MPKLNIVVFADFSLLSIAGLISTVSFFSKGADMEAYYQRNYRERGTMADNGWPNDLHACLGIHI